MADAQVSTRPILKDGDNSWGRVPYQVTFGEEFKTMGDAYRYLSDIHGGSVKHASHQIVKGLSEDSVLAEFLGMPSIYLGKPFFKDTRVGANDAINCLWQFNRDDDIVHEMMRSDPADPSIGMGRVYGATIEQNQTIAWFTFGIPHFTDLANFYKNAFNKDLITLNQTGFSAEGLGRLFGSLGALAFALPILPFKWLYNFAVRLTDYPVDRFYDLRATMHLYYKYVDSMLAEWLVNCGLYGNGGTDGTATSETSWTADPSVLPIGIRATGPSIWDILSRKARMLGVDPVRTTEDFEEESDLYVTLDPSRTSEGKDNWNVSSNPWSDAFFTTPDIENDYNSWWTKFKQTGTGATQFIGFRVEKNVDASESFSNSTGANQFAEQLNSQARENQNKIFSLAGGNTGVGVLDDVLQGLNGFVTGAAGIFGMDGIASAVVGGAFVDVPEQWTGSDFNKSHSLSFQLRAPYGDITSIYQSIMVPMCCILAGALPHAAGAHSYTQPFLCRVYCKGMFSIPLGIIDSISLKRGSSEFGWTYQNLPTCVDVNISIKDLSPIMYMAMSSNVFPDILGVNNSFREYMLTLSGTGLFERISRFGQIRRNVQLLSHKIRNQVTNPMFWTHAIATSAPAQLPFSISPWNAISHN